MWWLYPVLYILYLCDVVPIREGSIRVNNRLPVFVVDPAYPESQDFKKKKKMGHFHFTFKSIRDPGARQQAIFCNLTLIIVA